MTRYLSGLCVAGLGLCGGGWLIVATVAFGGAGGGAGKVNLATGAGLALASCAALVAWAVAWRRRMRTDGATDHGNGQHGRAFTGHAPSTAGWSAGRGGHGHGRDHEGGHHGGGHDEASAADVVDDLRTLRALFGPVVAATSHAPVLQPRTQHLPTPEAGPARPERPPLGAGLLAGDDELLRLAESEEAWW
jgi:hypothetical protein